MRFDDMQRAGSEGGCKRRRTLASPIVRFDPLSRQGIADLRESGGGRVCAEHADDIHSFEQPVGFVGCFGRHKHQLICRRQDVDASAEIGCTRSAFMQLSGSDLLCPGAVYRIWPGCFPASVFSVFRGVRRRLRLVLHRPSRAERDLIAEQPA